MSIGKKVQEVLRASERPVVERNGTNSRTSPPLRRRRHCSYAGLRQLHASNRDSLDDVSRRLTLRVVVELGRSRVRVTEKMLYVFDGHALFDKSGCGCCSKRMSGELRGKACVAEASPSHVRYVLTAERRCRERFRLSAGRAEEWGVWVGIAEAPSYTERFLASEEESGGLLEG